MVFWVVCCWPPLHFFSGCRTQLHVSSLACPGAITCVQPWRSCTGVVYQIKFKLALVMFTIHTNQCPDYRPILYTPTATMIRHAIGSAQRAAPTTLFHVWGRNLATELTLWPGQSCGTVCQQQFVTHSFRRRLKSHFLACVIMIDSVMPFRSGFEHGGH